MSFYRTLLVCFQVATISAVLLHRNHICAPSGYTKICILDFLSYRQDQKHVTHTFPTNQSHIRIVGDTRTWGRSRQVLDFDGKLYKLLGRPVVLEIRDHAVRNLEIPRGLRQGSFTESYNMNLTVEPGTDIPALVFLDLTNNYLRNISAIKSLVNLEVLFLADNFISSIDPSTMKDLTKLRYLDLRYNDLSKLSLNVFPKSLTHLSLQRSNIADLDYKDLYYPALEVFNIERNQLTSIDGPALILAMPKLKMARIGGNMLEKGDLLELLDLFQRHNISVRNEADEASCWYHEEEAIGGVCLAKLPPPRSVFRDILFSLAVILVATAMVVAVRWVFRAMNDKK